MKPKPKFLGIITARGGSKRVPGKNIRPLYGQPLLYWSLKAARESGVFDRIVLTTDDLEIAKTGILFGLSENDIIQRPAKLAGDATPHLPVLQHAVEQLAAEGAHYDFAFIIQPTAPLVTPEHFQMGKIALLSGQCDSVLGVGSVPYEYHYAKQLHRDKNGLLRGHKGDDLMQRGAKAGKLGEALWSTGMIYGFKTEFLAKDTFYGPRTKPIMIDPIHACDINTEEDFAEAERRLSERLTAAGHRTFEDTQ